MPLMKDPSLLLEPVIALVKQAGQRILEVYGSDFSVDIKEDNTPLTEADLAANQCLIEGLTHLKPRHPVISEESASVPYPIRSGWKSCWVIDPLDGTKEFIKRNGEFTVNVALVFEQQPVLGVVYAPVLDVCYFAAEGCGAYKQIGEGTPAGIRVKGKLNSHLTVVGSRSHQSVPLMLFLSRLGAHELKSMGSSLKFCLVAEGTADLYPRIGPTSEWDTAAAHCIVKEAGGQVTDLSGQELRYNARESFLNPYFLDYGDRNADWCRYAEGIEG